MWSRSSSKGDDAKESTPLLSSKDKTKSDPKKNWAKLRNVTKAGIAFRRHAGGRPGSLNKRASVRGSLAFPFFSDRPMNDDDEDGAQKDLVEPCEALTPLVAGGKIKDTDDVIWGPHPPPLTKSIPAFSPYRRKQRHRSFYLWWTNEFRHWWKSSRLLVRLGGLDTHARDPIVWAKMVSINPLRFKSLKKMYKIVKRLGQGGPMRWFLQRCHPFTRSLRILVGAWRWVESAQCRRLEIGVEETMAFIGNRVSRMLARTVVDGITGYGIIPSSHYLYKRVGLSIDFWHPAVICILMGILRAVSPYAASFQGSRFGRVLTRQFFRDVRHNWLPVQRAESVNLKSDDCCEGDEISENADLAKLAKKVAKALGKSQSLGVDGMTDQNENLAAEGFHQVGSGSGGYAVYECHRLIRTANTTGGDPQTILLHLTPYGPSLLDVMPRYMVLEKEDAQDRRGAWSEYLASKRWQGPAVVEGYAYQGAFFSPFHFAEMKERYDKQLLAYDAACGALPKRGRKAGPPTDLPSLKMFLANGKRPRKRRRNEREYNSLQKQVSQVARKLKSMMSTGKKGCTAPHGVILYFEGLDCSGKSSTGGLIEEALIQAGFDVDMRQYNRPPTEEQKRQPWMNRFEVPNTDPVPDGEIGDDGKKPAGGDCPGHRHSAIVWDRGPAGDFVYGALAKAPDSEKNDRYREFMQFDADCAKNKILFVKLMFITNRDSIAGTLGKRLAQRKMSQDLRTWLKASYADTPGSTDIPMEGLDMIDMHIDPTDFVAFNMYQHNLRVFMNFALNTDTDQNPWIVVNTGDRLAARKQLLRVFEAQLNAYARAQQPAGGRSWCRGLLCPAGAESEDQPDTPGIPMSQMVDRSFKKGLNLGALLSLMGLLVLMFYYCEHTTFGDNLNVFLDRFYGSDETVKDKLPSVVP